MKFDASLPPVLTHLDIHPGNVIASDNGRVCLIDWELACFDPQWFEYVDMLVGWGILGQWERLALRTAASFYGQYQEGPLNWCTLVK